ncbi:hypothetical protein Barb4_03670 [Bacteroidales bacterium Barb4]|nr:hypothetical protein Barb4_03670 [Bacteroidales bacterium Barb4]
MSYKVKASAPLIIFRPAVLASSIFLSSRRIPVSKVRRKDSSSSFITFSINVCWAISSG